MRRIFIYLLVFFLFSQSGMSQSGIQTWTENFDDINSINLSAIPANGWKINNKYYTSSQNSYRAVVPNMMGDSVILQTPVYNLTGMDYVVMRFKHICKVSPGDIVRIEYRITAQTWKPIPKEDYMGNAVNYDISKAFNAASYITWQKGDSLAIPDQSWWKEELFDLSNTVGNDPSVEFRFILKRDTIQGTQISYGWLIDDFEVKAAPHLLKDPVVAFIYPFVKDTVYNVGPWNINAKVKTTTPARIEHPSLIYTAVNNQGTFTDTLLMTPVAGDSLWRATIPQLIEGTKVTYSITGRDTTANERTVDSWYYIKQFCKQSNRESNESLTSPIANNGSGGVAFDMETGQQVVTITGFETSFTTAGATTVHMYYRVGSACGNCTSSAGWKLIGQQAVTITNAGYGKNTYVSLPNPVIIPANETYGFYFIAPTSPGGGIQYNGTASTQCNATITARNSELTIHGGHGIINPTAPFTGTIGAERNFAGTIYYIIGEGNCDDSNSVSLHSINMMDTVITSSTTRVPVVVTVKNKGLADLDSVIVSYAINGNHIKDTVVHFSPALPWDFNGEITLGNYNPRVNKLDEITVWVSYPNGEEDSITFDDTLTKRIYGSSDIVMEFVTIPKNTVYTTGPHEITAKINTYSGTPINTVALYMKRTLSGVTGYDTLSMLPQGGGLWTSTISNTPFDNDVVCVIRLTDILGNDVELSGSYSIRRFGGSKIDSIQVGVSTSSGLYNCLSPFCVNADSSMTRTVYLSSELRGTGQDVTILGLAYRNPSSNFAHTRAQDCYLLAVPNTVTSISLSPAINPVTDGATLVYSRTQTTNLNWNQFVFDQPFILPAGMNLIVYWLDKGSCGSDNIYWTQTDTVSGAASKSESHFWRWNCTDEGARIMKAGGRPLTLFYFGEKNRNNSAAMDAFLSPGSAVDAGMLTPVTVRIRNKGMSNLDSCRIDWALNGTLQSPTAIYKNANGLEEGFSDTITIGYYTPSYLSFDTIVAWVSMPNGVVDTITYDDTLKTSSLACGVPFTGTLTVGPGRNFPTINKALYAIGECGVGGDITILVYDGTYKENLNLANSSTLMGNYSLTIRSASGDRNNVIIQPPLGVVVTLNNTRNLTLESLTFNGRSTATNCVQFTGACTNIVIRNCNLLSDTTTTNTIINPLYKPGNTGVVDSFRLVGCLLEGGYNNANFYGGTANAIGGFATNIVWDSNTFKSAYLYGTYLCYTYFTSISHNTVLSRVNNNMGYWYGIYATTGCHVEDIIGNCIRQRKTQSTVMNYTYGIYLTTTNTTTAIPGRRPTVIANNEVTGNCPSTSASYGIYISSTGLSTNPPIYVLHNSIYFSGTGPARGITIASVPVGQMNVVKNNLIYTTGAPSSPSFPIYLVSPFNTALYDIDANNMYAAGAPYNVGYAGANRVSLADWQAVVTTDRNSTRVLPKFADTNSSLKFSNYLDLLCDYVPPVNRDIDGNIRMAITTTGCHEEIQVANTNVILAKLLGLRQGTVAGQSDTLKLVIMNTGTTPINAINLEWSINDTSQITGGRNFTTSKTLMQGQFDTITVGVVNYRFGQLDVKVWLNNINGGLATDAISQDDTLFVSGFICSVSLSGKVNIGPNGDYATLEEAFAMGYLCGVGDAVLVLDTGVYKENINLTDISDLLGNYSLTFTSITGNPKDVIIRPASGVGFLLNNSNNITIENITIDARSGTYGVQFIGNAANITINNCIILANPTSSTLGTAPIYKTTGTGSLNGITVKNCILDGGYDGIRLYGTTSNYCQNVIVDSNIISNSYYNGIYHYYVNQKSVSYNKVTPRSSNQGATWYGMYQYNVRNGGNIIGNRIHADNPGITSILIGLYTYSIDTALVANNEIILNTAATTTNGLHVDCPRAVDYINNSILVTGTGTTLRALYWYTYANTNYDATVKNNIFVANGGTATHAFYLQANVGAYQNNYRLDYNNYYSSGTNLGYAGTAQADLAAWQKVMTADTHSVNKLPVFINTLYGLKLAEYTSLYCDTTQGVVTDILNAPRNTPTVMGCYGDVVTSANASLREIIGLRDRLVNGESDTIKVVLLNTGQSNINSINLGWSINGTVQTPTEHVFDFPLQNMESDTIEVGVITYFPGDINVEVYINDLDQGLLPDEDSLDNRRTASVHVCEGLFGGVYSIGKTRRFEKIADAFSEMKFCGVGNDVVFILDSGSYPENMNLTNISDYLEDHSLTITSATGKAEDVVIQPSSGEVVTLKNTHNLTLESLTFNGRSTTANCVQFTGACTNIVIRNCNLLSDTTTTSTTVNPLYKTTGTGIVDNFRLVGCLLEGGYYNAYFYGGTANAIGSLGTNIVWDSNTFKSAYSYATNPYNTYFTSISHNTMLSRVSHNTSNWYGLYTNTGCHVEDIIGNRIIQRNTQSTAIIYIHGIYLNAANTTTAITGRRPTIIANNEITGDCSSYSVANGINISSTGLSTNPPIYVLHNSIYFSGTGPARGIFFNGVPAGQMNVIKNNLVYTTGSSTYASFPIYLNTAFSTALYDIDANNMYAAGAPYNIGYAGGAKTTFEAWRLVVKTDINSKNILPSFTNPTINLLLNNYTGLLCEHYPQAETDIHGKDRAIATTMGCYEGSVALNRNASLLEISGITKNVIQGDKDTLGVVLLNTGLTPVDSINIQWSVNGTSYGAQTVYYASPLLEGQSDTILLGGVTYTMGTANIKAWVNRTNDWASGDEFRGDDTVKTSFYVCGSAIAGTIIISDTSIYKTITQFLNVLPICSPAGDITLLLDSGAYPENVILTNIKDYLGNYSLTITSRTGKASDAIIRPASGVAFLLNKSDNIILDNITIDVKTGTYGVHFTGSASNITVKNCIISASLTAGIINYAPIYKATNTGALDGITIKNCKLSGGYDGIRLYGTSSDYCQDVIIDSNIISGTYFNGMYLYYVNQKSVSYNTVTPRSSNQGTAWYGLYFYYARKGGNIVGNKVYADNSGISTTLYGMRTYYMDSALIANNEIYLNSSATTTYGAYLYFHKDVDYLHNSILVTGSGGSAVFRAAYIYTAASSTYSGVYKNNIFIAHGGGTNATPYAVYLSSNPSTYPQYNKIDYNNYYSSGNLGYDGADRADLAAWKAHVTMDTNSVSLFPNFINSSVDLSLVDYDGLECPAVPVVSADISRAGRNSTTAIGCYQPIPMAGNIRLLEILTCGNNVAGQTDTVKVVLKNTGTTSVSSINLEWSLDSVSQISGGSSFITSLAKGATDTIAFGQLVHTAGIHNIGVWINELNGGSLPDEYAKDDTLSKLIYICPNALNGRYIVDSTIGYFKSLDEAFLEIGTCVAGDVVLALAPGTYRNNIDLSDISNTMGNYLLTLTSTTGNAADVIIRPASSGAGIVLNNSNNIAIKAITVDVSTGTVPAIQFTGPCTNVLVRDCRLLGNPTTTTNSVRNAPISKASGTGVVDSIFFVNNLIDGGYYGWYFYGGTGVTAYSTHILFDSNTVSNWHSQGTAPQYVDFISYSYNTVLTRTSNTSTTVYPFRVYYVNGPVIGNRIIQRSTAITSPYSVYLYYYNYYSTTDTGLFANNEIIASTTGEYYGMFIYSSKANILHNSIYMDGSGSAHGMYVKYPNDYLNIKNNNIVMNSSKAYPIYLTSTLYFNQWNFDYNNMYAPVNVGYADTAITTMAAWQSIVPSDNHSVYRSPSFIDTTSLELSNYAGLLCPLVSNVPENIKGESRTAYTIMGAYGVGADEVSDIELSSVKVESRSISSLCLTDYVPIKVELTNKGIEVFDFSTDPITFDIHATGPVGFIPFDTSIILNTGILDLLETKEYQIMDSLDIFHVGSYHISVVINHPKDTIADNDTSQTIYDNIRIPLPFNEEFEQGILTERFSSEGNTNIYLWRPVSQGLGIDTALVPLSGTRMIAFGGSRGAMAYLSTKQIQLSRTRLPKLDFWYFHDTIASEDYTDIRITVDGTVSYEPLLSLTKQGAVCGWKHYEVDLSPYTNGSCISLLFESMMKSVNMDEGYQYIDRMQIISQQDLELSNLNLSTLAVCDLGTNELKIKRTTTTNQIIDFSALSTAIKVDITGPANYSYTCSLRDTLTGDTSDIITIARDINFKPGTYTIKAYLTNPVDEYAPNDTARTTIVINPSLSIAIKPLTGGIDNCASGNMAVRQQVVVKNKGNMDLPGINLNMDVSATSYTFSATGSIPGTLSPGDSVIYTFDEFKTPWEADYFVDVVASLACDSVLVHAGAAVTECVDMKDLYVSTIDNPSGEKDKVGEEINIAATVINRSDVVTFNNISIYAEVMDMTGDLIRRFDETISSIGIEDTVSHAFQGVYTVPSDTAYIIKVYIENRDDYAYNDTLTIVRKTDYVDNIESIERSVSISMDQNIPNPANTGTVIRYNIPKPGEVSFRIHSMNGQLLYNKVIQSISGINTIEINTSGLSAGIYMYSMEYKGQRVVKRMSIKR